MAAGLFFSVTIVNAQFPNPAKVAERGLKGIIKKKDTPEPQKKPAEVNKAAKADSEKATNAPGKEQAELQAYSKYDFVPGDKVIFFEDFSQDAVGDFPALWTTDVAGEVNKLN
ncbi:MAG TPA: hypothetical protein VIL78_02405, partial [Hanamia sp.]